VIKREHQESTMGKKESTTEKRYKFETLAIAVCVALAFGFMAGAAFTVYKLDTGTAVSQMPPAVSNAAVTVDPDKESRIAMLEKVVAQNPDDAKTWQELGNLYFDTGRHAEAIKAYNKFLALNPGDPNVLTDLGVMYRRNGQPEKAVEAFDRAIAADPGHETSRFNKGIVLLHDLKDEKGALAAWKALLKVNPLAMAPNGQTVDELIRHFESHKKE
jgi:cytochrome c-type biogenesis protein CcmH/NrfG